MLSLQTLLCRIEKGPASNGCKYLVIAHTTFNSNVFTTSDYIKCFFNQAPSSPFPKHPLADSTYFLSSQGIKKIFIMGRFCVHIDLFLYLNTFGAIHFH